MYELFEHTADIGLRMRAANLDELFADAGRAMFAVMAGRLDLVEPRETVEVTLPHDESDVLLRAWLAELLYLFHTRRLLFSVFDVQVGPTGLSAVVRGEPLDPARHEADVEIKAVTWHGLKVEKTADGWLAEVILDI